MTATKQKIAIIPGDGIGREVTDVSLSWIKKIIKDKQLNIELVEFDWGADKWLKEGVGIPDGAIEELKNDFSAILFGAVGDPRIPNMEHGREILLRLRNELELSVNYRPLRLLTQALSPLKDCQFSTNIAIFRENTQGSYMGRGSRNQNSAIDECFYDAEHIRQFLQFVFDWSVKNGRHKITLVDKANAMIFTGPLWRETFCAVAKDYPTLETEMAYVDAVAMQLVTEPARFDVIATENLFGDILSDLGAALCGGPGFAASANLNPNGGVGLFEPVHGSAPDIAGTGQANPIASLMSVVLMLLHLGLSDEAVELKTAISLTVKNIMEQGAIFNIERVKQTLFDGLNSC